MYFFFFFFVKVRYKFMFYLFLCSPQLQTFFQRLNSQFEPRDAQDEVALNQSVETPDLQVVRIEDSFSSLLSKVGALVNRSVVLVSHFHHELDQALRRAFSPELQDDRERELQLKPKNKALDSAFLEGVGLDDVLDSFFDFGRRVLDEFGAVVTQAFSDIHGAAEKTGEGAFVVIHEVNFCHHLLVHPTQ